MIDAQELQRLREVAAYEARVVEAQLMDIARLGKHRRLILLDSIERLRRAALGDDLDYSHSYRGDGPGRELAALQAQRSDRSKVLD